jgi:glyoxylase-like metal-dependent hydrolase (beta-lactamase superfamily II)
MKRIKQGVFFETGYSGGTVGAILCSGQTILVDAPLKPEDGRMWLAELRKAGASQNRLVVNLDPHPDRTLGTQTLDAQVLAHRETGRQFRRRATIFKALKQESGSEWEETSGLSGLRWIMPKVTFSEHTVLHFDERELRVEYHPGPSPGSCWLVLPKEKIVFVGDAVVPDQPPFLAQANIPSWLGTLDHLASREFRGYTIISGRGGRVGTKEINQQRRVLKEVSTSLKKLSKLKKPGPEIDWLAGKLTGKYKLPPRRRSLFSQRIKYGLHNYFARHYQSGGKFLNNH